MIINMSSFLSELKRKRKTNKGRLEFHDLDNTTDPRALGLLPSPKEWQFECPSQDVSENIFIYGANTYNGQCFKINIKWRPCFRKGSISLTYKDENGVIYELEEEHTIDVNEAKTSYQLGGRISLEVLSPLRKWRIKVRSYLTRKEDGELVFTRIRMFLNAMSNPFDFTRDHDDRFIANELNNENNQSPSTSNIPFEDRIEQFSQLRGTIEMDNQTEKVVHLWGIKSKHYISGKKDENLKAIRIYGFDKKGFAFHIGSVDFENGTKYRYGLTWWGIGTHPITSILQNRQKFDQCMEQLKSNNKIHLKIDIGRENRVYDLEIEGIKDKESLVCDMKLNGNAGKVIIVEEELKQLEEHSPVTNGIHESKVDDLVVPINVPDSRNVSCCGGKGSSLASLYELSTHQDSLFCVPQGVVVTTNSYQVLINEKVSFKAEIDQLEKLSWSENTNNLEQKCNELVTRMSNESLPQKVRSSIYASLHLMFGNDFETKAFAVRSSAVSEDSTEMSTAGQLQTLLGVKGFDEICQSVMKCWSSQFTYIAVQYKRHYGQLINIPMAVVIQEIVDCDAAGVMFTCDPLNGDERKMTVTASHGLGESVVSASVEPDTITIEVTIEKQDNANKLQKSIKKIESIEIGSKLKCIKLSEQSEGGTIEMQTTKSEECCLKEEEILQLGKIGLIVEEAYNHVCDIEWGIKDGKIYLLQSRPITNLDRYSEWETMHEFDSGQCSERDFFCRTNFGEIFPGASSELSISWLMKIWMISATRSFSDMAQISKSDFNPYSNIQFGIVSNVIFANCKIGNPLFSMDQNSKTLKAFEIFMAGHQFNYEREELFADSKEKAPKKEMSAGKKISMGTSMVGLMFKGKKMLIKGEANIMNLDSLIKEEFTNSRELFDHIASHTCDYFELALKTYFNVSISTMMNNMMLISLLTIGDNDDEKVYSDISLLLSSVNDVVSALVPNSIKEIALSIGDPTEFCSKSDLEAENYLKNTDDECGKLFRTFLTDHGHRGHKELDVAFLQWGDNAIPVIKSIKSILSNKDSMLNTKKDQSIDEMISKLKTTLSSTKKFLLKRFILPRCREALGRREKGKYLWIWTVNLFRQAFWRLADLMVAEGRLPEKTLMFHLDFKEIDCLINERNANLVSRARQRKQIFQRKDLLFFDEIIVGPEIKPIEPPSRDDEVSSDIKMKGLIICNGEVKGRAFVALNLQEAQNIMSGDILITYSIDIGWSPYYPMISGLVTQFGGLISHGAVIAREFGLPCLVAVDKVCQSFKTGDIVILDANNGEIFKVTDSSSD